MMKKAVFFMFVLCISVSLQAQTKAKEQKVQITTAYGKIIIKLYNETPLHRDNFLKLVSTGFYDSLLFHRVIKDFVVQGGDPLSKNAKPNDVLGITDNGKRVPSELNPKFYHKRGVIAAARDDNPLAESSSSMFHIVQGRIFTTKELNEIENTYNVNAKKKLLAAIMESDSVKARLNDFALRGDKEGLKKYMLEQQIVLDKQYEPYEFKFSPTQIIDYLQIGGAPHLDRTYTVFGEVISGMEIIDKIASLPVNKDYRPTTDIRMKIKILKQ
jgi:cyclophilin family peptidyl-prolyl cis-trans isomerase